LVPMDMDAFCLTVNLADDPKHTSRICPVTQPDYTGLRLKDAVLQHDILDHVDLHKSTPANFNPRLYDLGSTDPVTGFHIPRENRLGKAACSATARVTSRTRVIFCITDFELMMVQEPTCIGVFLDTIGLEIRKQILM
jgi:hypothetical protein